MDNLESQPLVSSPNGGVLLELKNVSCKLKDAPIVTNISVRAREGSILALLSPSGGGKTTTLDIISGRKNVGTLTGQVLANGRPLTASRFKTIGCFVPQDDVLIPSLTVRETLHYAALLRLPRKMSHSAKLKRAEEVIKDLGLSNCADSLVGGNLNRGISGGEARRLSIGIELLKKPKLLLLDEPTSGLCAAASFTVLRLLSNLARNSGTTVVCSLHQPRVQILDLIDQIMLLSEGKVVYAGPCKQAVPFFDSLGHPCPSNCNPCDFLLDLMDIQSSEREGIMASSSSSSSDSEAEFKNLSSSLSRKRIAEIVEKNRIRNNFTPYEYIAPDSEQGIQDQSPASSSAVIQENEYKWAKQEQGASFLSQVGLLCSRSFVTIRRSPLVSLQLFIGTMAAGLLLGLLFTNVTSDYYDQMTLGISFLNDVHGILSFLAIPTFISARRLFIRESQSGTFSAYAYGVAKVLCDMPVQILTIGAYCTMTYKLLGLRSDLFAFLYFMLINMLTLLTYTAINESIGALCSSVEVAIGVGGLANLSSMMTSGVLVQYPNIPSFLKWIYFCSPMTYSVSALLNNEFKNDPLGQEYLKMFSPQVSDLKQCAMILVAMAVGFRALCFLVLKYLQKERR